MKKFFSRLILFFVLNLLFSKKDIAQNLNMGSIVNFIAYTTNGAVSNTGTSTITGNAGTNLGAISGFDPGTMNGNTYSTNAVTDSAKKDLLSIYIHLQDIPETNSAHASTFGGETILPGVYSILTNGSLTGTLVLDGQGNNNAFFVIKFDGAFTVTSSATVNLINGARAANVFWIAEGAIDVGSSVVMKGTVIAHPGSITFGAGSNIDGRMLSIEGAIAFNSGTARVPSTLSTIPLQCQTSPCNNSILGSAANYALFTTSGATTNAGASGFIGNIGSNTDPVSGFANSIVIGTIESNNSATVQAKNDLLIGYNQLMLIPATNSSHVGLYGNGETVTPGVYNIASIGSIQGLLTLDGLSNPNAQFIFRFASNLSSLAHSKVVLVNGARRCNIFWIAEGAVSLGAFSYMKGYVIAHGDANNMASNGNLEGSMFSTSGAVGFSTGVSYTSYNLCGGTSAVPLKMSLTSFIGNCENQQVVLKWNTASEQNSKYFAVERSIDGNQWQAIDKILAAGNSTTNRFYTYLDKTGLKNLNYFYRLNCIDFDGSNNYGTIITVKKCTNAVEDDVVIYPNASSGIFNIFYTGGKSDVTNNKIFNERGELVYSVNSYQQKFDLTGKAAGMYFVRTQLKTEIVTNKIFIIR